MTENALLPGILFALKLVLDVIKAQHTPDKKRERLAKDLFKLYLDLVEISDRGRELLSYVAPNQPIADNFPIEVLRSQQAALIGFQRHLDNVAAILEVHLPSRAKRLEVLTAVKGAGVAFLLAFLIDMPPITLNGADWKKPEIQALVEKCKSLGLGTEWELCGVIPLPEKPWIKDTEQTWDVYTVLIASPADIDAVRRVLDEIATIQEELRKFLVEKFKMEDVL